MQMKHISMVLVLLISSFTAHAGKVITPDNLEGATIVKAKEVKSMMAGGAKLYDVRKKADRVDGFIPGSISLPYKEKSSKKADYDAAKDKWKYNKLPSDKSEILIFQCNGETCWKSYKAAKMALVHKHKKVYWFRTGLPGWKDAGFDVKK